MFSTKEMEMIYVACMEMGDKLSNIARELERFDCLNKEIGISAKEFYGLARKIKE